MEAILIAVFFVAFACIVYWAGKAAEHYTTRRTVGRRLRNLRRN